jgi:hypothetical protein
MIYAVTGNSGSYIIGLYGSVVWISENVICSEWSGQIIDTSISE